MPECAYLKIHSFEFSHHENGKIMIVVPEIEPSREQIILPKGFAKRLCLYVARPLLCRHTSLPS